MFCENCGEKNLSESKFCKTCGHLLNDEIDQKPKTEFDDLSDKEKKTVFSGSWGAFVFGPIYFIAQKAYVSALVVLLFLFIPIFGWAGWVYYAFNAKQIAFKKRKWKKHEDFLRCQRSWDLAAKVCLIVIPIAFLFAVYGESNTSTNNTSTPATVSCNEQTTIQNVKNATHTVNIFDRNGGYVAYGSGFALDGPAKGLILTNYHVIEGAYKISIWIGFEGKEMMDASIFASYPDDDMALLKVDYDFPYKVSLANSDQVKDAETLYAVGWANDPSGDATITKGILSRRIKEDNIEILQTDAPINPGNSGGPLINNCGVIGMNTAKLFWADYENPAEGTGYALSSNYINRVIYKE